jgi:hypothetical protein
MNEFVTEILFQFVRFLMSLWYDAWNSQLLENGSLTRSVEMRIRGERHGTERPFHINGIYEGFQGYAQVTKHFPRIRASNKTFSMDTR